MKSNLSKFCATLLLTLGGCAHPTVSAVENDRTLSRQMSTAEYRLGVDDRVRIIVFDEQTLSGEFQIGADGNLSFPLVGAVPAVGKTTDEVALAYQAKLSDGYLVNPRVSAEVVAYRPFFILGEVKTPGKYPYAVGLTALNAIATAAGFTPRGDKQIVFIRKSGEAMEKPYKLSPDLMILPGDTVRIGERFF